MSRFSLFLATFFVAAASCPAPSSLADEFDELKLERVKARYDYMQAVLSGPRKTPEEKRVLKERIVLPVEKRWQGYTDRITSEGIKKNEEANQAYEKAEASRTIAGRDPSSADSPQGLGPVLSSGNGGGASRTSPSSSGGTHPSAYRENAAKDHAKRPDYVLDGKDVPAELDFSKPAVSPIGNAPAMSK